jgi:hypothetical protein
MWIHLLIAIVGNADVDVDAAHGADYIAASGHWPWSSGAGAGCGCREHEGHWLVLCNFILNFTATVHRTAARVVIMNKQQTANC